MSKGSTKDERYLCALYEKNTKAIEEHKDDEDYVFVIDRYALGKELGISPHITNQIVLGLLQANFVKKESGEEISITKWGCRLVEELSY